MHLDQWANTFWIWTNTLSNLDKCISQFGVQLVMGVSSSSSVGNMHLDQWSWLITIVTTGMIMKIMIGQSYQVFVFIFSRAPYNQLKNGKQTFKTKKTPRSTQKHCLKLFFSQNDGDAVRPILSYDYQNITNLITKNPNWWPFCSSHLILHSAARLRLQAPTVQHNCNSSSSPITSPWGDHNYHDDDHHDNYWVDDHDDRLWLQHSPTTDTLQHNCNRPAGRFCTE